MINRSGRSAGTTSVDEGDTASYTVALSGTLQAGETATINLTLSDVSTDSADYAAFEAAVIAAIGSRTDLTFVGWRVDLHRRRQPDGRPGD